VFKDLLVTRSKERDTERRTRHQEYVAAVHSGLVMSVPAMEGVFSSFTMNTALHHEGAQGSGTYADDPDVLVIAEHVGTSRAAYAAAARHPDFIEKVVPDEEYLVSEVLSGVPVGYDLAEIASFEGSAHAAGGYRVFDFLARRPGVRLERFITALVADATRANAEQRRHGAAPRQVINSVTRAKTAGALGASPHGAVIETWIAHPDALLTSREGLRERQGAYVDASASFSILARERTVV
jgi:hypothetical protein